MSIQKRTLVAGAAIAAVGMASVGSIGLVSAATNSSSASSDSTGTTIVDKIASKFNLNKTEVQAVFDQERSEHHAQKLEQQQERLAQAVTDGKLTQAQADHITQALKEIQDLKGTAGPGQQSDETRDEIKSKMDALRTWAKDNNLDMRDSGLMMRGGGHGGGHGGMRGHMDDGPDDDSQDDSSDDNSKAEDSTN